MKLTIILIASLLFSAGFVWYTLAHNLVYFTLFFAVLFGYNLRSLVIELTK